MDAESSALSDLTLDLNPSVGAVEVTVGQKADEALLAVSGNELSKLAIDEEFNNAV